MAKQRIYRQYGALPFRLVDGKPEVLLITSRETKRWIIPKGNPMKKKKPWEVAKQETLEESGVTGTILLCLSNYKFKTVKKIKDKVIPCIVKVYLLRVDEVHEDWIEKEQRSRCWMTIPDAISNISETGLVELFNQLSSMYS